MMGTSAGFGSCPPVDPGAAPSLYPALAVALDWGRCRHLVRDQEPGTRKIRANKWMICGGQERKGLCGDSLCCVPANEPPPRLASAEAEGDMKVRCEMVVTDQHRGRNGEEAEMSRGKARTQCSPMKLKPMQTGGGKVWSKEVLHPVGQPRPKKRMT